MLCSDLAITVLVAGFWDTLLYSELSPLCKSLHAVKFNPAYPKPAQLSHDVFWALVSTVVSSAVEIGIFHAWARGALALAAPAAWWAHPATVAWVGAARKGGRGGATRLDMDGDGGPVSPTSSGAPRPRSS